jgi:hypothetical protein
MTPSSLKKLLTLWTPECWPHGWGVGWMFEGHGWMFDPHL